MSYYAELLASGSYIYPRKAELITKYAQRNTDPPKSVYSCSLNLLLIDYYKFIMVDGVHPVPDRFMGHDMLHQSRDLLRASDAEMLPQKLGYRILAVTIHHTCTNRTSRTHHGKNCSAITAIV